MYNTQKSRYHTMLNPVMLNLNRMDEYLYTSKHSYSTITFAKAAKYAEYDPGLSRNVKNSSFGQAVCT